MCFTSSSRIPIVVRLLRFRCVVDPYREAGVDSAEQNRDCSFLGQRNSISDGVSELAER